MMVGSHLRTWVSVKPGEGRRVVHTWMDGTSSTRDCSRIDEHLTGTANVTLDAL